MEPNGIGSSGIGSTPTLSLSPSQSLSDINNPAKDNLGQLMYVCTDGLQMVVLTRVCFLFDNLNFVSFFSSTLDGISFSLCGGLSQGTVTEGVHVMQLYVVGLCRA